MWAGGHLRVGGTAKFFLTLFGYDSLENYYRLNFNLIHDYKYSLGDLEMMLPWERDIYVTLLIDRLNRDKIEREKHARR